MVERSTLESDGWHAYNVGNFGRFGHEVQYALTRSQCARQRRRQVGKRAHRTKRAHHCNRCDDKLRKRNLPLHEQPNHGKQHAPREQLNKKVREGDLPALHLVELAAQPAERRRARIDLLRALRAAIVLDGLVQPVKRIQDICVKLAHLVAHFQANIPAAPTIPNGNDDAYDQVRDQGDYACNPMLQPQKHDHERRNDYRDGNGRNRMGVKHFQQLDVARDERNEVALIASLQLGRRQRAQLHKHLVPDDGQHLKGYVMVAVLLAVMQQASSDGHGYDDAEEQRDVRRKHLAKRREANACDSALPGQQRRAVHSTVPGEYRNEDGTDKPDGPQQDSQNHDGKHRLNQPDETPHDAEGRVAAPLCFRAHYATSLP